MWFAGKDPPKDDLASVASWAKDMNIIITKAGLISTPTMVPVCDMFPILLTWRAAWVKDVSWMPNMVSAHLSITYNIIYTIFRNTLL